MQAIVPLSDGLSQHSSVIWIARHRGSFGRNMRTPGISFDSRFLSAFFRFIHQFSFCLVIEFLVLALWFPCKFPQLVGTSYNVH